MRDYGDLQKIGLSYMDIKTVEHIENGVLKGNAEVSRLIAKAHNLGFKKGVKESVKFIDHTNKGVEY